eukprot:jgi/Chrzof1/12577/UNPLg00530.t1
MFITKQQAVVELHSSLNYFGGMTKADKQAKPGADAWVRVAQLAQPITNRQQQAKLRQSARTADGLLRQLGLAKVAGIPWRLIQADMAVEGGYPRTHGSCIFLPVKWVNWPDRDLVAILIHEKVHVFQRLHPAETNQLILHFWGYQAYDLRANFLQHPELKLLARSNPDLNGLVYGRNGTVAIQAFDDLKSAVSLASASLQRIPIKASSQPRQPALDPPACVRQHHEHPYEEMAYLIAGMATGQVTSAEHQQSYMVRATLAWVTQLH